MAYKAVIFDMDGTILDTLEDMVHSINAALAAEGFPTRTVEEVRRFVGHGNHRLAERAVPAGTDTETIERVFRAFHVHYRAHCADHTRVYEGIPALLTRLRSRGVRVAVVSNKADYAVQDLAARYFPGLLDGAAGERPGVRRKPAPDGVLAVLAGLGIPKGDAVYVGDSDVDIETAQNAGLPCISVTWGFRSRDFLLAHGAKTLADSVDELERLLS